MDEIILLREAAEFLGVEEYNFRNSYVTRFPPNGHLAKHHPYWTPQRLAWYQHQRNTGAINIGGTLYYPSHFVARKAQVGRQAIHLAIRKGILRPDIWRAFREGGSMAGWGHGGGRRPYFSVATINNYLIQRRVKTSELLSEHPGGEGTQGDGD